MIESYVGRTLNGLVVSQITIGLILARIIFGLCNVTHMVGHTSVVGVTYATRWSFLQSEHFTFLKIQNSQKNPAGGQPSGLLFPKI
jgi:hypothetical protein